MAGKLTRHDMRIPPSGDRALCAIAEADQYVSLHTSASLGVTLILPKDCSPGVSGPFRLPLHSGCIARVHPVLVANRSMQ
jgi:hypothetical protein